ncbi:hypothetical protein HK099_007891 [Clydaea vesicula]|uniref:DUF3456 domain-containing protein n=1 Tax=Clydaea vesicula TaxID=447962 RepID=A0AAD5U0S6_9FUNG|nr:hypothetical protein HK099_007891 [Clydaea vesicula]KAJ3397981.1 hypothetical protein HDU92_000083 [Lobulomyces angularis]
MDIPNGEYESSKKIHYSKSEIKLLNALENICNGNPSKNDCQELVEDFEDTLIYKWFMKDETEQLFDTLCSKEVLGLECSNEEEVEEIKGTAPEESPDPAIPFYRNEL